LLLALRTLPHLHWRQIVYRPVRQLQRLLPAPPRLGREPGWGGPALLPALLAEGPADPAARLASADRIVAGDFTFLQRTARLGDPDWRRRHVSHLWSYQLHYFEYAVDLAWASRLTGRSGYTARLADLLRSWIEETEPGRGDGWEPYPIAVRLEHWLRALALAEDAIDPRLRSLVLRSVAAQAEFLRRRLEYHLLGNHLAKDLFGLAVAGLYCTGPDAGVWRRIGLGGFVSELAEQVLPDGAHYERSASYHALALGDVLQLVALLRAAGLPVPREIAECASGMILAAGVLIRPDGRPHGFNDAAEGMGPCRASLDALADAAGLPHIPAPTGALVLPDAGYFGFACSDGTRLLVDAGPLGPSYQPAHGHCDLLSFELDLAGVAFVIDSGVHGYDGDPFREYARSTRAHNTVSIGGAEQSELWGTFRAARRAQLVEARATGSGADFSFAGAYRPYHKRAATHRRTIVSQEGVLIVTDRIDHASGRPLVSYLHLHPDWRVELEGGRATARRQSQEVRIEAFGVDDVRVVTGRQSPVQGWYFPRFGVAAPAPCLECTVRRGRDEPFGYRISTSLTRGS
jgi:uncharacterized heparinase superfamily protein